MQRNRRVLSLVCTMEPTNRCNVLTADNRARKALAENAMPKCIDLKQKAKHCRELLRVATAPEVREQLGVWAREFEEQAKANNLAMLSRQMPTNSAS
jgi:hypothetical protein